MTQFPIHRTVLFAALRKQMDNAKKAVEDALADPSTSESDKRSLQEKLAETERPFYNLLSVLEYGSDPACFPYFMVDRADLEDLGLTDIRLRNPIWSHGLDVE